MKIKNGFTLIELLVVVAILAILAVIGFAVISGTTSTARDVRRKADIDAITKAHETTFNSLTGKYKDPLMDEDFTSGKKPVPPEGGNYRDVVDATGKTYITCAVLEGAPANMGASSCTSTDDNCYCRRAAQGPPGMAITAGLCTTVPTLTPGGTLSCRTEGGGGIKYVDCPSSITSAQAIALNQCASPTDSQCYWAAFTVYSGPSAGSGTPDVRIVGGGGVDQCLTNGVLRGGGNYNTIRQHSF